MTGAFGPSETEGWWLLLLTALVQESPPFVFVRRDSDPLPFEEVSQQRAAFLQHDSASYLRAMIEPGVSQ